MIVAMSFPSFSYSSGQLDVYSVSIDREET